MGIKPASRTSSRARPRVPVRAPAPARTGLADALFTATQQRVLGLLFGQPERSFFATELIGLAGAGRGAVQRELRRLEESGLVATSRVGNQKHYRANAAAPIFTELRDIINKTGGPGAALRTALDSLRSRVRFAALYGSVAKGSDRAQSDIDLLVVADELTLEQLYAALASAEKQLGRTISPTLYTSAEFRKRRANGNPFVAKLLAGDHQVLIGDEYAAGGAR
jgi:predicted nucleotidyltransferase